jgi:hypothetical protein
VVVREGIISFLARERTIVGPGFNRWLIPPAAGVAGPRIINAIAD